MFVVVLVWKERIGVLLSCVNEGSVLFSGCCGVVVDCAVCAGRSRCGFCVSLSGAVSVCAAETAFEEAEETEETEETENEKEGFGEAEGDGEGDALGAGFRFCCENENFGFAGVEVTDILAEEAEEEWMRVLSWLGLKEREGVAALLRKSVGVCACCIIARIAVMFVCGKFCVGFCRVLSEAAEVECGVCATRR